MTITPPSNIDYGTVVWRAAVDVIDSADPDVAPDYVPPTGFVTFVSSVGKLLDPGATPDPITILRDPIVAVLDDQGYLCTADAAGNVLYRGVHLIANDDPDLNPQNSTYIVSYDLQNAAGKQMKFPESHLLTVLTGQTVDLTNFIPPSGAEEVGIPQAQALAAAAADSAAAAQASAAIAAAALADVPGLVDDSVADAAEVQLAGLELDYQERITTFTSTATASPGTAITGISATVVGKGRPVDFEFNAFQVYHSVANTAVIFMLAISVNGGAAAPFFFGLKRSPATTGGDSAVFRKRLVVPNGQTWVATIGVWGAAAGTCTVARDSTYPISLGATSR